MRIVTGTETAEARGEVFSPSQASAHIPLLTLTGAYPTPLVGHLLSHVLSQAGLTVGLATREGRYTNGAREMEGDATRPVVAQALLADPRLHLAVLETRPGRSLYENLGYDWADVAVLTTLQTPPVHRVELAYHIWHVVERVRPGGTIILNADEGQLVRLMRMAPDEPRRETLLFSIHSNSLVLRAHLKAGGTAYLVRQDWLGEVNGARFTPLAPLNAETTLSDGSLCPLQALLAAVAACRACGLSQEQIQVGLSTFNLTA